MRKGLSKGINDKIDAHNDCFAHKESVANAVVNAYKVNTVSSQHTNNVSKGGKFTKPSVPSKV